jgi:hypothetical protein
MIDAEDNVIVTLVSTKTPMDERKPTWSRVEGKMLFPLKVGLSIMIARTNPDPHPYWQTSQIESVVEAGGKIVVRTRNSVYEVERVMQ